MPGADIVPLATVLDASVAVRWLVTESGSAEAVALLARPTRWIAPRLMLTEVAGALHRKVAAGELPRDARAEALEKVLGAVSAGEICDWPGTRPCMAAAFALATLHQHRVADCIYLALCGAGKGRTRHRGSRLGALARARASPPPVIGGLGMAWHTIRRHRAHARQRSASSNSASLAMSAHKVVLDEGCWPAVEAAQAVVDRAARGERARLWHQHRLRQARDRAHRAGPDRGAAAAPGALAHVRHRPAARPTRWSVWSWR